MQRIETVIVNRNQTLYDIAVQWYGNVEATRELLENNPDLVNDPQALSALDIDRVNDLAFYLDVALRPGLPVRIDTQSHRMKMMITKQLNTYITTFNL